MEILEGVENAEEVEIKKLVSIGCASGAVLVMHLGCFRDIIDVLGMP